MQYQEYTLEELLFYLQENYKISDIYIPKADKDIYQLLFCGLDTTMLQIMCTQVTWSLSRRPPDTFITTLLEYANQITDLIPLWQTMSHLISIHAKQICKDITGLSNTFQQQPTEKLIIQITRIKNHLCDFSKETEANILSLQKKQSNLSTFIAEKLTYAIPDQTKWENYGLELCLNNDKFINGTKASIYNGSTMFSLVIATLNQSIGILKQPDPLWDISEIVFTILGQATIWEIIYNVCLQLNNILNTFHYIPPYQPNIKGGNTMYINNNSAESMLQLVQDTCKGISIKGSEKSKLAQQLLRLMNGDFKVLKELPSLNPLANQAIWNTTNNGSLVSETSESSINDSKGLLGLTKENIIDIKTYVKTSLSLKTTNTEEAVELGYTDDAPFSKDHPEFSPTSFAHFNQPFHQHALSWNSLETDILQQGNNIQTYGTTFVSHASFVLEQIKTLSIFQSIEDVKITDPNDKKVLSALSTILDRWKNETNKHSDSTTNLLNRLKSFQDVLHNTLSPSANSMAQKLNNLDIQKETLELKEEIDSLKTQIEAKHKEYNKDCLLANSGAIGIIGGPIVLITWSVTGGIYGAKAEKIRKEYNELENTLNTKQSLYNNLNKVASHVHKATSGIENLKLAVTNAIIGLESLNTVWGLLDSYITEAKEALAAVDKKSDLINFSFELESAQAAWNSVPSLAAGLLKLFKEAELSFKLNEDYNSSLQLDTQTLIETCADKTTWNDKYTSLNQIVINPASEYMPTLQNKAIELRNDAISIYRSVLQSLPILILSKGKMLLFDSDPNKLDKLTEIIQQNPSDKQAIDTLNFQLDHLKKDHALFSEKLIDFENNISENVTILSKNTRTDLHSIGFYSQLNTECKRFAADIQSHTKMIISNFIKPMQELAERMKKLDEKIEEKIDPENLIKEFKEFLPSSSEISDMFNTSTVSEEDKKLQAIKLIYEAAMKGLDVLANTITLCQQIEEQNRLSTELGNLKKDFDEINQKHQKLLDAENELHELLYLHEYLTFFALEGNLKTQFIQENRLILSEYLKKLPIDYTNYNKQLSQWIQKTQKESEE